MECSISKIFLSFKITIALVVCMFSSNNSFAQCQPNGETVTERVAFRENGQVDFTVLGASQNPFENNDADQTNCNDLVPELATTATLSILPSSTIRSAYLYWSGTGDILNTVSLNGIPVSSDRCWMESSQTNTFSFDFFSARADVTNIVRSQGNGDYTLTGLNNINEYTQLVGGIRRACTGASSLLYGGWALVVIFEDPSFSNNTVFVLDGFSPFVDGSEISINLQTNVFDDFEGSHVGVIAWEGDDFPFPDDNVDFFQLNGNVLPSGGFTDPTNIFNGTNSFVTPTDVTFFNGDLDDFDASGEVQNLLNTTAANFNFNLRSGQDFILLNTLVMRLPNEAPDALVEIPNPIFNGCSDSRTFQTEYTYFNSPEASQNLPAGLPVTFYLNGIGGDVVGTATTPMELAPGQSDTQPITITIPDGFVGDFTIIAVIDDPAAGGIENFGMVLELFEENNTFESNGFIDQIFDDLRFDINLCDGESTIIQGVEVSTSGEFPFNDLTVRGGCDSIGVATVIIRENFDVTNPLEEVCEGNPVIRPNGIEAILEPRDEPYEFSDNLGSVFGCDSIVNSSFLVLPNGLAEITPQICLGEGFVLPDGIEVFETGSFTTILPGGAANGCDSLIVTNLEVLDIAYPNAFAPNGNGVNDGFRVILPDICPQLIDEYDLKIFNRWGEQVFQTNDFDEAWDGDFENELGQAGFFLWFVEYTSTAGQVIRQEGGVSLIR